MIYKVHLLISIVNLFVMGNNDIKPNRAIKNTDISSFVYKETVQITPHLHYFSLLHVIIWYNLESDGQRMSRPACAIAQSGLGIRCRDA